MKQPVCAVFKQAGCTWPTVYRVFIPRVHWSLVSNVLHECDKRLRPMNVPLMKTFINRGHVIQFAKILEIRKKQVQVFEDVLLNYVCWHDDAAGVWKVEPA